MRLLIWRLSYDRAYALGSREAYWDARKQREEQGQISGPAGSGSGPTPASDCRGRLQTALEERGLTAPSSSTLRASSLGNGCTMQADRLRAMRRPVRIA